jgi:hypothetical protein
MLIFGLLNESLSDVLVLIILVWHAPHRKRIFIIECSLVQGRQYVSMWSHVYTSVTWQRILHVTMLIISGNVVI